MLKTFSQFENGGQEPADIEKFVSSIPNPNRVEAINHAREQREKFIAKIWGRELSKLPQDIIDANGFSGDIVGWEKYLQFVYSKESEFQKRKFSFEEWSVKYIASMVTGLEQDTQYISQLEKQGEQVDTKLLKVPNSYYEAHSKKTGFLML